MLKFISIAALTSLPLPRSRLPLPRRQPARNLKVVFKMKTSFGFSLILPGVLCGQAAAASRSNFIFSLAGDMGIARMNTCSRTNRRALALARYVGRSIGKAPDFMRPCGKLAMPTAIRQVHPQRQLHLK